MAVVIQAQTEVEAQEVEQTTKGAAVALKTRQTRLTLARPLQAALRTLELALEAVAAQTIKMVAIKATAVRLEAILEQLMATAKTRRTVTSLAVAAKTL